MLREGAWRAGAPSNAVGSGCRARRRALAGARYCARRRAPSCSIPPALSRARSAGGAGLAQVAKRIRAVRERLARGESTEDSMWPDPPPSGALLQDQSADADAARFLVCACGPELNVISVATGQVLLTVPAEEDEYTEFLEAAMTLLPTTRVRVAQVFAQEAPGVMARYRRPKMSKRTKKTKKKRNISKSITIT